jgi:cellulose synthase operon protein C
MPAAPRVRTPARRFSRLFGLLVAAPCCLTLAAGCAGSRAQKPPVAADEAIGSVTPVPVDDAAFAPNTYRLLMGTDTGRARASLLAGVVARQLVRAQARFDADQPEAGIAAMKGAFFLMRRGEFRREGLASAAGTLEDGAAESARLGQEGYSLALYSLLDGLLPPGPQKDDVQTHLKAMAQFSTPANGAGRIVTAGADAKVAAQRALLDSSVERFNEGSQRLLEWIGRANGAAMPELPFKSMSEREELIEAQRAQRGGGFSLVALYLRHGDALGALTALDEAGLERSLPEFLRARMEAGAEDEDADAWLDLFRFFAGEGRELQAGLLLDPELFEGAAWGTALSLFRAEPGSFRGTMPLAMRLVEHGMAEVAPLVLYSGLARGATPDQLSTALAFVLNAMVAEDQDDQHDAARRTFGSAAPLLEAAAQKSFAGRISPSPARVRYVMGALEADRGELDRARPLLEAALAEEPAIESLRILAAIARQKKDAERGLGFIGRARQLAERTGNTVEEAELWHTEFELRRDSGDRAGAGKALETALVRALDATRQTQQGPSQARAERLLARILEHFGERAAVQRATERALEASATDSGQLSATVIDSARRALTRRDLQGARAAVEHAVDSSLPADDIIYVALWLKLLEQELSVPSDGSVENAFAAMSDATGWTATLRAWGRGKLGDTELFREANGNAQRTEALFYTAMARRVRGDASAEAELEKVARSEAVNLVEIGIARDLLALRAGTETGLKLPKGVSLP